MTTIAAWLSVSATGPRTFYLGADSQGISLQTGQAVSLREKKVFDSASTPEIFTLSGDLMWGSSFLRRLLIEIDRGSVSSSLGTRMRAEEFCRLSCARPPLAPICELEILYGVRSNAKISADFQMYRLHHAGSASSTWQVDQVGVKELGSDVSALVYSSGLGGRPNKKRQKWISEGDQGNVARICFWSLCDLIDGIPSNSFMTGGHPQLVKLDQDGCGNVVGVKFNGVPTVYGRRTTAPQSFAHHWVDENFTQLDPKTLEKYKHGQRYGRGVQGR
ncbi:hypothetical protein AB3Y40_13620 [Yoonia sp. R2331]|uniref:hypothetical protein n=1 Tax=Yoonia sp. R2331 TaxID=3237238 RepID=UPI0034E49C8A